MGRRALEKLRRAEYVWSVGREGKAADREREDRKEGREREAGSVCVCVCARTKALLVIDPI